MGCVGNTASITSTGGNYAFTGRATEIGGLHEFVAILDDSDLSVTAQRKYCSGEIIGRDPIAISARVKNGGEMPTPKQTATTFTITWPAEPGTTPTTPPLLTGSGFVNDRVSPTFADDELLVCTFEIMLDGDGSVPTYVAQVP